jgi:hypothetical protein
MGEEFEAGPRFRGDDKKGAVKRKAPRWQMPFLRALVRTGDVRASAEDAGIDWSTAYQRRKTHADFADLWLGALGAHKRWQELKKMEEMRALNSAPPPHSVRSPSPRELGEDLIGSASQVKRAGHDRWNQRKEKAFFEELAATANVKRAAKAAGVSPNAVYARRMRDAHFKAKWAAVLESGRASIEMHLVEAANRSFEPEELDTGAVEPKVSVAEAIRIVQVHGSKKSEEELPNPFAEQAASMTQEDVAELRERIIRKLRRLRDREKPKWIAEGWSFDEEHDHMVPPGWVRASGS